MKNYILMLILFSSSIAACQKENPKTIQSIVGRYAVAVEYQNANVGFPNVAYYNDTLIVTRADNESQLKITSLNNIVILSPTPTGNEASLQFDADTNGTNFSAVFFNEKSIQYESTSPTETRKHSGEKVSN